MKNLFTLSVLCILFYSCGKNDTSPTTYVSGHLYETCGGAPVKNRGLYIYQLNAAIGSTNTNILATGSTDSTGYFKIPYGTKNPAARLELRLEGGNYAVIALPANLQIIDSLKVYLHSTCNIVVKLNVINPYTVDDTLTITNYNPPYTAFKIAGPFENGILYTANDFQILLPYYIGSGLTGNPNEQIRYTVNDLTNFSGKDFLMQTCATSEVVIDIE
ncbi:MAG: hypothetical protein H7258_15410 [Ferruginibacter sp.]|nr:hypothetical protein [Ferruginibacter sp.]